MKLEWNTRINLRDHEVLLHEKTTNTTPRVTIGLPTYRRGHLIRRALASIATQSYRNFVLVISDNAGKDPETLAAVKEFSGNLPEVVVIAQKDNIGALENFKFLLAAAKTEYFMWLADDDEISPDYLEELVGLLDADPGTVTAMGRWKHMTSPTVGMIRSQIRLDSTHRLHRLFRFVAGNADDSSFYGVHRTSSLRKIRFNGYLPPNKHVLTNWCYLFLFDMLFQGRFAYSDNATWICHNYSEKEYNRAPAHSGWDRIKTLLLRLNVHAIYIGKTARKGPILIPAILVASLLGFTRDIVTAAWRLTNRAVKHRLSTKKSSTAD